MTEQIGEMPEIRHDPIIRRWVMMDEKTGSYLLTAKTRAELIKRWGKEQNNETGKSEKMD